MGWKKKEDLYVWATVSYARKKKKENSYPGQHFDIDVDTRPSPTKENLRK